MLLLIVPALLALVLPGNGTLHAQAAPPAAQKTPQQNLDLDAIWKYAGTWEVHTEVLDTAFSNAATHSSILHNDCWRSGAYIACRQIVDGQSNVLIVFTCGAKAHVCTSYQIPADGSPATDGIVNLEGDTWTFPWQTTDKDGKITYFHVVNVWTSPTYIEYRQEYSADQVRWTKTAVGHEVKTGTK